MSLDELDKWNVKKIHEVLVEFRHTDIVDPFYWWSKNHWTQVYD